MFLVESCAALLPPPQYQPSIHVRKAPIGAKPLAKFSNFCYRTKIIGTPTVSLESNRKDLTGTPLTAAYPSMSLFIMWIYYTSPIQAPTGGPIEYRNFAIAISMNIVYNIIGKTPSNCTNSPARVCCTWTRYTVLVCVQGMHIVPQKRFNPSASRCCVALPLVCSGT